MHESSLRQAADQPRAQGGLPLLIECHERVAQNQGRLGSIADRVKKNVDHLRGELIGASAAKKPVAEVFRR